VDAEGLSVACLLAVKLSASVPLYYTVTSGTAAGMQKLEGELEAVRNGLLQCISYMRKSATPLISTLHYMIKIAFTESYYNIL